MQLFRFRTFRAWYGLLLAVCVLTGCAKSDGVPVTGTASFDGTPIEEGSISFVSTEGKLASEGAIIQAGQFSTTVTPGPKRVQIRGSRPIKPRPGDPESSKFREDFIPARYNSDSTLTAEISATGDNILKFDLTSK